jgi:hypothetical protein
MFSSAAAVEFFFFDRLFFRVSRQSRSGRQGGLLLFAGMQKDSTLTSRAFSLSAGRMNDRILDKERTIMEKQKMIYQQLFDFDKEPNAEVKDVQQRTSKPPPVNEKTRQAPPLVRPDRQIVYPDAPNYYHWPDAKLLHDHDTITVDRVVDDIDGPAHRFVIKRGDTVETYIANNNFHVGTVIGVSHAREEVRVAWDDSLTKGGWFHVGRVYPAPQAEVAPDSPPAVAPYTFEDFKRFHQEFREGTVSFEAYHAEFKRLWESQDALTTELVARYKAKELQALASRFGSWDARRNTKEENADSIVRGMLGFFVLDGGVRYSPLSGETYESALRKNVESVTAGSYFHHFEKKQEESLAREQALADPQSFDDFRLFIREQGEEALSDEQLARYDSIQTEMQRGLRAENAAKSTVQRFQSDELQSLSFIRKEGYHDKRECPLFIVQLESRVERDAFNELNRKAKQLGGWYSSFKKSDAGFQFVEQSQADRFCELLAGDVDRTDVLERRKERKELSAAEALHELAARLAERAEETIARSNGSLQNTARRADIQAGIRGRSYAELAMSRTMHSLAEGLSRGEAKFLDGIRHKTELETLDAVLYLAKWARVRAVKREENESSHSHGQKRHRIEEEPVSLATIRFVEFPYPHLYKRTLIEAMERGLHTNGVKQAAEKLKRHLGSTSTEYIAFSQQYELDILFDFIERAKGQGIDVGRLSEACEKYKRLVRSNITSLPELRAALREYLEHRAERRGDDPQKIAERELIGKDLPGFFPTPRPVIERMLELAQVEPHHQVLEPSCGKGDILDAVKELHPELLVKAIEQNRTLSDVLAAKGYEVEFSDFLSHAARYDRIVMNPPFENGQDIEHVQHAYSILSPGGGLVSVMSEGPFFRSDKKAAAFREWLAEVNGESEELPEDAFQGKDAFRQTGTRTRLVTIHKEDVK